MTSDNLEQPLRTLAEKMIFYGAYQNNLYEDRPILSAAKSWPMNL